MAPGGQHLYPAMPCLGKGMSRQDADDIYAYLMTRPVVDVAIPANEMPFPFNQRMALIGWNLLFLSEIRCRPVRRAARRQWQRGRYLADVLQPLWRDAHAARRWRRDGSRQADTEAAISAASWRRTLRRTAWRNAAGRRRTSAASSAPASRRRVPPSSEMHMVVDLGTRHLTPERPSGAGAVSDGRQPPAAVPVKMGRAVMPGAWPIWISAPAVRACEGEGQTARRTGDAR
ncbi:hypothetical protein M8494_27065 [Serratia ureilytica]